jgi:hypothetical protein
LRHHRREPGHDPATDRWIGAAAAMSAALARLRRLTGDKLLVRSAWARADALRDQPGKAGS